jgi:GTP-binding protein HflX
MNKIDMLGGNERESVLFRAARNDNVIAVSAVTGENCETLCKLVDERLSAQNQPVEALIPHEDGAQLAWLYRHGDVQVREERDDGVFVRVMMPPQERDRYLKLYKDGTSVTVVTEAPGQG